MLEICVFSFEILASWFQVINIIWKSSERPAMQTLIGDVKHSFLVFSHFREAC